MIDDHLAGDRLGHLDPVVLFQQRQRAVDAGGGAGRRPDRPIGDEDAVLLDLHLGVARREFPGVGPGGGGAASVQQASLRQDEGAGACRHDTTAACRRLAYDLHQPRRRLRDAGRGPDDEGVVGLGPDGGGLDGDANAACHQPASLRHDLDLVGDRAEFAVGHLGHGRRHQPAQLEAGINEDSEALHGPGPRMS